MNLRFIQKQYKAFPVFSDFALKSIFCSQKNIGNYKSDHLRFSLFDFGHNKVDTNVRKLDLHVMEEFYSDRKLNGNTIPVFSDFVSKSTVFAQKSRKIHT